MKREFSRFFKEVIKMIEIKAPNLLEVTYVTFISDQKTFKKDELILRLEGKKGNVAIKAPENGSVLAYEVKLNDEVKSNQVLVQFEEEVLEEVKIYCPDFKEEGIIKVLKLHSKKMILKGEALIEVEIEKGNHRINAPMDGICTLNVQVGDVLKVNDYIGSIQKAEVIYEEKTNERDLIVIGGGPGGYVAAIYAAIRGLKVTLIEKERLGGTCLNVGCIPTKALVKASEVYDEAARAECFGIEIKEVIANIDKMMDRKEEVVNTLVKGVEYLMAKNDIEVINGTASFKDYQTILINGEEMSAKDIIIATGSKISKINLPGLDLPFVLDSTKALSYRKLPKSMVIIGGGVIGMEFAFIYANLGVEVSVVEYANRILSMLDEEVSYEILKMAKEKGIQIHLNSKVTKIEGSDHAIVTYLKDEKEETIESENVLYAIGREPNIEGLNIEASGVLMDRKAIVVDDYMKTNVDHIYAIGDVTNIIQLAHVASHQGMVAVENILGHSKKMDYKAVPNVIFTHPEIASVGLVEQDLNPKEAYSISKFNFNGNGKALTMDQNHGFVKIIKENKTNHIVGASIIGPDASSLINTLTVAIQNGLSVDQIIETIFPHPTTGEAIAEAALGLKHGSIHA